MRSLDLPQILYQPFAATGDKNTILNSPSTEAPQRANLQTGFPPITQIPIDNGGIPPERMDFNGLGYLLSSFYFFTQCGGVYTFNRNVSNAIGGYPLGAVLYYTDSNGTTYKVRSLLENNTFDFVTTPSYIDDEHWAYVSSTPITQDTSASSTSNVFSTAAVQSLLNTAVQSLLNTVVHLTGNQTIAGTKTFSAATYGTASDAVNSIVTTTGINKAQNGYVKLGNGLIIQWGTSSHNNYVSFPVPFQSADSYQIGSTWLNQSKYCDGVQLTHRDAAGFSFAGRNLSWVAIGY